MSWVSAVLGSTVLTRWTGEKEPQSRWEEERDGPGEVVEAKRSWGTWGGGARAGVRVGLGDPLRERGV